MFTEPRTKKSVRFTFEVFAYELEMFQTLVDARKTRRSAIERSTCQCSAKCVTFCRGPEPQEGVKIDQCCTGRLTFPGLIRAQSL